MSTDHLFKLKNMFLSAKVNREVYSATTINLSEGYAEISFDMTDKFFHALGAAHGSVYFKLLDDAAYFAVSSLVHDNFVLTTSFNIHFLRPISDGSITAKGTVRSKSKNLFTAESTLFNETGKELAFGTGTFRKSQKDLSAEIGYHL